MHLFKTLFPLVLLYECLEDHKDWRILRIRSQQKMTNIRMPGKAEINDKSCEVQRSRWNWIGHILRREGKNDCLTVVG